MENPVFRSGDDNYRLSTPTTLQDALSNEHLSLQVSQECHEQMLLWLPDAGEALKWLQVDGLRYPLAHLFRLLAPFFGWRRGRIFRSPNHPDECSAGGADVASNVHYRSLLRGAPRDFGFEIHPNPPGHAARKPFIAGAGMSINLDNPEGQGDGGFD